MMPDKNELIMDVASAHSEGVKMNIGADINADPNKRT